MILQNSASALLACALSRLFPKGEILGGGPQEGGFYCEIVLDFPLDKGCLPLLEEHIRQLVSEKLPMRIHTMVRDNAKSFLWDKGGKKLREGEDPVVEIAQIGNYYGEGRGEIVSNTGELAHLALLEVESSRIWGLVGANRDELKEKLRGYRTLQGCDHRKQRDLLFRGENGGWILGTELTKARLGVERTILSWLGTKIFTCLGEESVAEGSQICEGRGTGVSLKDSLIYRFDRTVVAVQDGELENRIISSLQLIEKWNKMLSFEGFWSFHPVGKGNKSEWKRAEEALRSSFQGELKEFSSSEGSFAGPRLEYYWIDKGGIHT